MRIISQDGTMDYPYEQCGVFLGEDDHEARQYIYAYPIGGEVAEMLFASYKSREAAEDALRRMRLRAIESEYKRYLKFFRFPEDQGEYFFKV